jgi:hypothetical protein
MRMLRVVAVLATAAVTAGCLSVDSNIKVKPDGTGIIEQTTLVNSSAMGMLTMMGESPDGGAAPSADAMFSEERLRADAAKLGEGVTYVSSTPVTQGEMKGVKAIYSFTDFNKLSVSTSPDIDAGDGAEASSNARSLEMSMQKRGGSSLLSFKLFGHDDAPPAADTPAEGEASPFGDMPKEMLGMFAPMFKDMRVAVSVEPQGELVRTNATHVEGQKITILDIAFGELFADPAGLEKLEKLGKNPSLDEVRAAFGGVKGFKLNEVDPLEVEFK